MTRAVKCFLCLTLSLYAGAYLVSALPPGYLRSVEDVLLYSAMACSCVSLLLIAIAAVWRTGHPLSKAWYLVAVVALLLAFGSPGYLDPRDRRMYAHTLERMRKAEMAIGNYCETNGKLPRLLSEVKVSDIDNIFEDPYAPRRSAYHWLVKGATNGLLISVGPDGILNSTGPDGWVVYDTTNGTVSTGDIVRTVR